MLIAQAEDENLVVITRDPLFKLYGVRPLPA
jgi:PIN domain nuclease of toxin-antitoxin system